MEEGRREGRIRGGEGEGDEKRGGTCDAGDNDAPGNVEDWPMKELNVRLDAALTGVCKPTNVCVCVCNLST